MRLNELLENSFSKDIINHIKDILMYLKIKEIEKIPTQMIANELKQKNIEVSKEEILSFLNPDDKLIKSVTNDYIELNLNKPEISVVSLDTQTRNKDKVEKLAKSATKSSLRRN